MKFAARMSHIQKSFVREILKVTENKEVISFAGGLPNPDFFPAQEIADATRETWMDLCRQRDYCKADDCKAGIGSAHELFFLKNFESIFNNQQFG